MLCDHTVLSKVFPRNYGLSHKSGGFSKSITIMSNAKNPRKIIRIKGIVNKEISLLKEKSIVIDN